MSAALTITIKLGNAAMQTGEDVGAALEAVGDRLRANYGPDDLSGWNGLSGGVLDANGNAVGRWAVES